MKLSFAPRAVLALGLALTFTACDEDSPGSESGPSVPGANEDTDNDGLINSEDPDDDNDGFLDEQDAFPFDPTESRDLDGDGVGDNADTDDDNDGIADVEDAFPTDPGEPLALEHGAVVETTTQHLRSHVRELDSALTFLEESELVPGVLDATIGGDDEPASSEPMGPFEEGEGAMPPDREDGEDHEDRFDGEEERFEDGEEENDGIEVDLEEILDEIVEVVEERFLVESTLESTDGGLLVYRLSPELICEEDVEIIHAEPGFGGGADSPSEPRHEGEEDQDNDGEGNEEFNDPMPHPEEQEVQLNEDCVTVLTDVGIWIRASSFVEGDINFDILVGADRLNVLRLEAHGDLLAAQVDLGAARAALQLVMDALEDPEAEEEEGGMELPESAAGVIRAQVFKNADLDFTGSIAILEELRIEDGGDEPVTVSLGTSDPTAALHIDGPGENITVQLGLGEINASLPYQWLVDMVYGDPEPEGACSQAMPVMPPEGEEDDQGEEWDEEEHFDEFPCGEPEEQEPTPEVQGTIHLLIAGLGMQTSLSSGQEEALTIQGMGLGDKTSSLKLGDATLAELDLNAEHGRSLDISIAMTEEDEQMRIQLSPALDLAITLAMKNAAELQEEMPDFMNDSAFGIRFDGADTPTIQTIGEEDEQEMQVAAGNLTFWSRGEEDIVISAGQCMMGGEDDVVVPEPFPADGGSDGFEEPREDAPQEEEDFEEEDETFWGDMHGAECGG